MRQYQIVDWDTEEECECLNEDAPSGPPAAKLRPPKDKELPAVEEELLDELDGWGAPLVHPCGPGVGGD